MVGEASKLGVPFMLAMGQSKDINKTRLIEAVIYALISGIVMSAMGYYIAFPVLQKEVATIQRDVASTNETMKSALREMKEYQELRRQYRDLEQQKTDAKLTQIQVEMARMKR